MGAANISVLVFAVALAALCLLLGLDVPAYADGCLRHWILLQDARSPGAMLKDCQDTEWATLFVQFAVLTIAGWAGVRALYKGRARRTIKVDARKPAPPETQKQTKEPRVIKVDARPRVIKVDARTRPPPPEMEKLEQADQAKVEKKDEKGETRKDPETKAKEDKDKEQQEQSKRAPKPVSLPELPEDQQQPSSPQPTAVQSTQPSPAPPKPVPPSACPQLNSGANVPVEDQSKILAALNRVAASHGVDPAAIAAIIDMESKWDTRSRTDSYSGLTQVGPEFLEELGLTKKQFLDLTRAEQIEAYGRWLDYYEFTKQMKDHNVDCLSLPPARQAALLQAMQFAPNGKKWKAALAQGDLSVRATSSDQAEALGDTSIGDMEKYYAGFFEKFPASYESPAASASVAHGSDGATKAATKPRDLPR